MKIFRVQSDNFYRLGPVFFIIEHCIIGETLFITSSPHLGAFYNNAIFLLPLNRLFLNNVKVEYAIITQP